MFNIQLGMNTEKNNGWVLYQCDRMVEFFVSLCDALMDFDEEDIDNGKLTMDTLTSTMKIRNKSTQYCSELDYYVLINLQENTLEILSCDNNIIESRKIGRTYDIQIPLVEVTSNYTSIDANDIVVMLDILTDYPTHNHDIYDIYEYMNSRELLENGDLTYEDADQLIGYHIEYLYNDEVEFVEAMLHYARETGLLTDEIKRYFDLDLYIEDCKTDYWKLNSGKYVLVS